MVFWPFFGLKISFLRFYPGKLSPIIPKPLLIDSTAKNTSSEVYLGSLAYRAENARKAFYYGEKTLFLRGDQFATNSKLEVSIFFTFEVSPRPVRISGFDRDL